MSLSAERISGSGAARSKKRYPLDFDHYCLPGEWRASVFGRTGDQAAVPWGPCWDARPRGPRLCCPLSQPAGAWLLSASPNSSVLRGVDAFLALGCLLAIWSLQGQGCPPSLCASGLPPGALIPRTGTVPVTSPGQPCPRVAARSICCPPAEF